MKLIIALMLAAASWSAQSADNADHLKKLIEQHKSIAAVHEAAAQCLASGKKEEACHEELAKACKSLPTIGKLCGMAKHRH